MRIVRYWDAGVVQTGVLVGGGERETSANRVQPVASLIDTTPIGPDVALERVRLLAPVIPRVVVGMAHNTGVADRLLPPSAFLKPAGSVIGPLDAIEVPDDIGRVDAEAELAAVIGRRARDLHPATALDAVLGWTCANDVTARDLQANDDCWTRAKGYDTFTPLGPWVETDPAFDPDDVVVRLDEIGATSGGLARSVGEVLAYLTSFMTLDVGDVVLLGAPGPSRPLHDGDVVSVTVAGLGTLRNPVRLRQTLAVAR
ncbi:fumarylacetoacetate hydrolase family protein [Pengzhenrongella sicca]|uniref:Fumarylacetoacetate hydrolase family protein n=1 Tax=Pengzhenrongella sicca TaxID=2819238 RepID=A0A8A4ZC49_9MICO|nr:fumarylacetoacetate hydrolase family protein [Pengzhenrongella sicca]QTE28077.1 fumarylacetoacetate hydrolase family protein [Pengzhenrongella sicca]